MVDPAEILGGLGFLALLAVVFVLPRLLKKLADKKQKGDDRDS